MSNTKRFRPLAVTAAVLVLSAIILAATLWPRESSTSAHSDVGNTLTELHESAMNEGVVSVWCANVEEMQWIVAAFQKTYPGIAVELVTDLNVVSRVVAEARADRHAADVVWSSEAVVRPLIERDLLLHEEWERFGVKTEDVGAEGHMLLSNSLAFAVAYRKDRVSADDVPTTWNDLLLEKYRGKLAAGPILFARLTAALGAFEGEEAFLEYAKAFRRDSRTLWTNDLLEQTISSGERPYVVAITDYLAEGWKARGIPVEVVLPEPVYITQFGAVVLRHAPHPNAARLLAIWMSSPQGRQARDAAGMGVDLRQSSDHPKAVELRASGKRIHVDTNEAREIRNRLIPQMDRIMAGL